MGISGKTKGPENFLFSLQSSARNLKRPVFSLRRGQTAIEYLLVTVSLLTVFIMLYRSLQWYLAKQFTSGGVIILRMYKEDPW